MELTLKKERHIQFIIENFDFEKVHNIMTSLNWKWYCYSPNRREMGLYVPTIEQLKKTAVELLEYVYDDLNYDTTSTGGFKATRYDDHLGLEFVLSSFDSESINYDEPRYEIIKNNKIRKKKINTLHENN